MSNVKSLDVAGESLVASSVVSTLLQKGIKLLALDFDKTIIDLHTGGAWRGPSTKLFDHVRPCMKALLEAALLQPGLEVCVVTFSTQPGMIEDVLRGTLTNCDTSRVLIRAVTKDWLPQGATAASNKSPEFLGKEEHLIRVLTDLYNQRRVIIQSHEVLLIDDDIDNVRLAEQFGHLAFKVEDDVELSHIASFVDGLPAATSPDEPLIASDNESTTPQQKSEPLSIADSVQQDASASNEQSCVAEFGIQDAKSSAPSPDGMSSGDSSSGAVSSEGATQ